MIDLESVKNQADLLAIAERDTTLKKVANSGGGEYAGPCPICGGKDRFRVQPGERRWLCRHCTGGKWDSVIGYIARRDNLDPKNYQDLESICKRAAGGSFEIVNRHKHTDKPIQPAYSPPVDSWQESALAVIEYCRGQLWDKTGSRALDYLRGRGLKDSTIQRFSLGYSTGESISGLWVSRGIVIPCSVAGETWYLKIRQPKGAKYICVKGSRPAALFNADDLSGSDIALICEGEFDCMIAYQELNKEIPSVTLGSATNQADLATWGRYLRPLKIILAAYDSDKAGESGAARLSDIAGQKAKLCPVPEGKDINDFYQAGGDLWGWIQPYLDLFDPIYD